MDGLQDHLESEFRAAINRIGRSTGPAALREILGRAVDDAPFADEIHEIQAGENLEMGLVIRQRLVERAQRLSAALARVRDGRHGLCDACGGPIGSSRLRALPEATTCVHCQEQVEQTERDGA